MSCYNIRERLSKLIKYLLMLAASFALTLFVPAESYYGLALFAVILSSSMLSLLEALTLTCITFTLLIRRIIDATKH